MRLSGLSSADSVAAGFGGCRRAATTIQLLKGSTITLQSSSPIRDDQPSENR